jgi:pullulanase
VQRKSGSDTLARTATYAGATGSFTIPPRSTVVFVEKGPHEDDDD